MKYFYYDSVVYRQQRPGALFERWINGAWQSASGEHPMSQEEHLKIREISEQEAQDRQNDQLRREALVERWTNAVIWCGWLPAVDVSAALNACGVNVATHHAAAARRWLASACAKQGPADGRRIPPRPRLRGDAVDLKRLADPGRRARPHPPAGECDRLPGALIRCQLQSAAIPSFRHSRSPLSRCRFRLRMSCDSYALVARQRRRSHSLLRTNGRRFAEAHADALTLLR